MEYEKIKQLIDDMGESKLTSISIDFPDGTKISMTKGKEVKVVENSEEVPESIENNQEAKVEKSVEKPKEVEGNIIKSPMVGTFYSKPSPSADPYVTVGDTIKKGETVCIVEAMKLMNEIESEFDGEIAEIYLKDGETVEYGTPLFRVK